mmetsp:Transcript_40307/g.108956  ORF Transcript_40307/g.108956 Transcript_40307/m.108956 type:complete len:244 (-) Transcript_40307:26-757(-)|eukprot:CAMPEP_0171193752 /NCGR_PEP_ID=MMETSP0790-20130122/20540_1 /TAXON_ID=2925 /ORGANISM="Alexandrium catenella, Strain OF101" /LENGTH=243 /DNA_ID=CAMNT_0011658937 /DNA_START=117 /DNA_END=848 /DNA_ORIENTATION=-
MATPGQLQMYNKLEVGEMFGLDHRAMDTRIGRIHRIHVYPDEKVPNAATLHVWVEDHTLGNLLRMELLRNEAVLFVGYKVPHPLNHMIELRVQTLPKSSPELAIRHAIANLKVECKSMLDQFDEGVREYKEMVAKSQPPPVQPAGVLAGVAARGLERGRGFGEGAMETSDVPHSTSEEPDGPLSPGGEERDQRFQAQLEEFERIAGQTSTSFSPSYSPSTPAGAPDAGAGPGAGDGGDAAMQP